MARWNPALHPRLPNGRFRPKLSQSVRVSTRSVSYNVGARIPIVPGRAALYAGGLVRLERTSTKGLGNSGRKVVNSIARRLGDSEGTSMIARIVKGQDLDVGGFTVRRNPLLNAPTIRITPSKLPAANNIDTVPQPRARRQRTRPRSANSRVASTMSGVKTHGPKAIAKKSKGRRPQRRTAQAATRGRRIK